jgi:histidyl-tRNA synthetase
MTTSPSRLARGMRDLLPAAMRRRQQVIDTLRGAFETYGFDPLDTPAVERAETLLGKYGPDAERLIYRVGLGDEADLALRYDLTVPLARVCAVTDGLPRPFKRYQIGPVWRGERPQRGRYREFVQADVDIVGCSGMLADAEIIALVIDVLDRLGLRDNVTKLNNRKLLAAIGAYAGVPDDLLPGAYRAIDKLDKLGLDGVRLELGAVGLPMELLNRQRQAIGRWLRGQAGRAELEQTLQAALTGDVPSGVRERALPAFFEALTAYPPGDADDARVGEAERRVMAASVQALRAVFPPDRLLSDETTDRLLELLQLRGDGPAVLDALGQRLLDATATAGLEELSAVLDALAAANLPPDKVAVDCAMVRGLDYYTGTIFETVVTAPPIGSITGGGRYDRLMALFGRDLPAVGTSFGVDRLVDVMVAADLFPAGVDGPSAQVLVARFSEATTAPAVGLVSELRAAGIRAELYLGPEGLGDQIRFALKRAIPVLAILGPDELAAATVTLRDLVAGSQQTVPRADLAATLRAATTGGPSELAEH